MTSGTTHIGRASTKSENNSPVPSIPGRSTSLMGFLSISTLRVASCTSRTCYQPLAGNRAGPKPCQCRKVGRRKFGGMGDPARRSFRIAGYTAQTRSTRHPTERASITCANSIKLCWSPSFVLLCLPPLPIVCRRRVRAYRSICRVPNRTRSASARRH